MSKSYTCIYDVIDDESFRSVQDEYIETGATIRDCLYLYILPPNYIIDATVTISNNELSPLRLAISEFPSYLDSIPYDDINCGYYVTDDNDNDIITENYGSNISLLSTDYNLYNDDTLTITRNNTYIQFNGPTFYYPYWVFPMHSINGSVNIKNKYNHFYIYNVNDYVVLYNNILTFHDGNIPIYYPQYETVENNVLHIKYSNNTNNAQTLILYNDWTTGLPANTRVTVQKTITPAFTCEYDLQTFNIPVNSTFTTSPVVSQGTEINFSVNILPTGFTFNNETGEITCNISQSGSYNITVTAQDNIFVKTIDLTFNIVQTNYIYNNSYPLQSNIQIVPINPPVSTIEGTITFNNILPSNSSFNSETGIIQLSNITDPSEITIQMNETLANTTISLTRIINIINTSDNDVIYLGTQFSYVTNILITLHPYHLANSYTLVNGLLPSGLSLNTSSGVISGTTTVTGQYELTIQSGELTQTITININKAITSFYYANNTITLPSSNYTKIELIPYTDGTNYTCNLETGTLPEGLELLSTGVIKNNEYLSNIQSGVYNITVICDNGSSISYSLTINVIDNYLGYETVYNFMTNSNITITPVNTYTGLYSSDNLPDGLSIENGIITGIITRRFISNIKVNYSENNVVNNASNIIESYCTFQLLISYPKFRICSQDNIIIYE